MRYSLITPPAETVVSLAQAKAFARVDFPDEDEVISGCILAADAHLDGRFGVLGRALVSQQWRLDAPCGGRVFLDLPPVISVDGVKVWSGSSLSDWDGWRLGYDGDRAFVEAEPGAAWPSLDARLDAVQITFTAGYGDTRAAVPASIHQAALWLIGHFYDNREAATDGKLAELPFGVSALLTPYRVLRS